MRQGQGGGAVLLVGPDVGERLQHAARGLQQGRVAVEPPLCLQGPDPLQGEPEGLGGFQARIRAGRRVLAVGAAQQFQCAAHVAMAPTVVGRGVQHLGQYGPFAYRAGVCGGPFGGVLGLTEQLAVALDLPQAQDAARVLRPQLGVGARMLLALGGAPQQLHGVHQVLHHVVRFEVPQQDAGALHRRVRCLDGAAVSVPVGLDDELLGQRHESLQYADRDLGEGVGDARTADCAALPVLATLFDVLVGRTVRQGVPGGGGPRRRVPALAELGEGQGREIRPALPEPLLDVLRAVLEYEQCLVAAQRTEQRLADAGRELVPLADALAGAAATLAPTPGQQSAQQHLGEFGRSRVRQHRALHQLHHRQIQRGRREVDGQLSGRRRGCRTEPADHLERGQSVARSLRGRHAADRPVPSRRRRRSARHRCRRAVSPRPPTRLPPAGVRVSRARPGARRAPIRRAP